MVNKIWAFLLIIGITFSLLNNNVDTLNKEILTSSNTAFEMVMKTFPLIALWSGIMNIASKSGLLSIISKKLSFILRIIFKDIPKDHEALSLIASNIVVNMFGLGNVATPLGLKAMKSMQELNENKSVASRSMITFLIINTCGLTIIPTTVISLRTLYKSANPTLILPISITTTIIATIIGLTIDRIINKIRK